MNLALIKRLVSAFHVDMTGGSTSLNTQNPGPVLYNAMLDLIDKALGEDARKVFANNVDATDDSFYLNFSPMEQKTEKRIEAEFETFWKFLMKHSVVQDDNELMLRLCGFSEEKDNEGQVVLYTSLKRNKKGKLVEMK